MSAATTLQRTMFETSRASEYFNVAELVAQTGQPKEQFPNVVVKELFDNAFDACEAAGVAPDVLVEARWRDGLLHLAVEDNGPGLAPWAVQRILNFDTRTSDKTVYRAPTRGAQADRPAKARQCKSRHAGPMPACRAGTWARCSLTRVSQARSATDRAWAGCSPRRMAVRSSACWSPGPTGSAGAKQTYKPSWESWRGWAWRASPSSSHVRARAGHTASSGVSTMVADVPRVWDATTAPRHPDTGLLSHQ
jgi:hypothetical protein